MVLPVALVLLQLFAVPKQPVLVLPGDVPVTVSTVSESPTKELEKDAVAVAAAPEELADAGADVAVGYAPGRPVEEPAPVPETALEDESSSRASAVAPGGLILSSETAAKRAWDQRQRRIWLALTIAQSSAAAFDAWSTRLVVSSGRGSESNPMLRPFSGNGSMYAAIQVGPLLLDYVGRRMLASRHGWARHTWWIPQAVGTIVSVSCGASNLGVYGAH